MKPVYLPFTYLSETMARTLSNLFGPVVVYQPVKTKIPEDLKRLESDGMIEICAPIEGDEGQLHSALSEFTDWAKMNPASSSAGADFIGARQGDIPFFGETAVQRIRSDINRYRSKEVRSERTDVGFGARLFLAVAQENDRTTIGLDHDLSRFKEMEKDFLESLEDDDEAGFRRRMYKDTVWREDPGARRTGQRLAAWAFLAAAEPAAVAVTTSPAVIDYLMEIHGEVLNLEKLIDVSVSIPVSHASSVVTRLMEDLSCRETLSAADFSPLTELSDDAADGYRIKVSLFAAVNCRPEKMIRCLLPDTDVHVRGDERSTIFHTLIALVDG